MNIIILDDCGDTSTITDWAEGNDGLNPADNQVYVKQGSHSMALGIDADKNEADFGFWDNTQSLGDLSAYQHDWLYLWVYFPTLDYVDPTGAVVVYTIGSDDSNSIYFAWFKADLSVGWNLLKCDLDNPYGTTGAIDWTAISYQRIRIAETEGNTNDFTIYADSIMIIRNPATIAYNLGISISMSDAVALYPEWDYSKGERQVRTEHRSKSGKLKLYKWYDYEKIYFQNNWVQASDAALVNSWWDTNTKLLFFVSSDFVTEVHSVMIMNDETPLASYNKPYNDHFKGKIELEGY